MATETIQIQKNVPIQTALNCKYPFHKMQVGDSFITQDSANLISATSMWSIRHVGVKFSTRKQPNGKRRVWRVA